MYLMGPTFCTIGIGGMIIKEFESAWQFLQIVFLGGIQINLFRARFTNNLWEISENCLIKGGIMSEDIGEFLPLPKNIPKNYLKLSYPVHNNDKVLVEFNRLHVKKYYSYEIKI